MPPYLRSPQCGIPCPSHVGTLGVHAVCPRGHDDVSSHPSRDPAVPSSSSAARPSQAPFATGRPLPTFRALPLCFPPPGSLLWSPPPPVFSMGHRAGAWEVCLEQAEARTLLWEPEAPGEGRGVPTWPISERLSPVTPGQHAHAVECCVACTRSVRPLCPGSFPPCSLMWLTESYSL